MALVDNHKRSPFHGPTKVISHFKLFAVVIVACSLTFTFRSAFELARLEGQLINSPHPPPNAHDILRKCRMLNVPPGPPADFHLRTVSDRYEQGTPAILLKNATIWTGRESGKEVIHGDLLLDKGLIKAVGDIVLRNEHEVKVIELHGAWVTPG